MAATQVEPHQSPLEEGPAVAERMPHSTADNKQGQLVLLPAVRDSNDCNTLGWHSIGSNHSCIAALQQPHLPNLQVLLLQSKQLLESVPQLVANPPLRQEAVELVLDTDDNLLDNTDYTSCSNPNTVIDRKLLLVAIRNNNQLGHTEPVTALGLGLQSLSLVIILICIISDVGSYLQAFHTLDTATIL